MSRKRERESPEGPEDESEKRPHVTLDDVREFTESRIKNFVNPFTIHLSKDFENRTTSAVQVACEIGATPLHVCVEKNGSLVLEASSRTCWMMAHLTGDVKCHGAPEIVAVDSSRFLKAISHSTKPKDIKIEMTFDSMVIDLDLSETRHSLKTELACNEPSERIGRSVYHFDGSTALEFPFKTFIDGLKAMVGEVVSFTKQPDHMIISSREDGTNKRLSVPIINPPPDFPSKPVYLHLKHLKTSLSKLRADTIQIRIRSEKVEFRAVYLDGSYITLIVLTMDSDVLDEPF
jgi:hypothetical protein